MVTSRAKELELKKAELGARTEAVEARRAAGLEEIRKKATAFGAAWSPQVGALMTIPAFLPQKANRSCVAALSIRCVSLAPPW